jgi:hypothetical protein
MRSTAISLRLAGAALLILAAAPVAAADTAAPANSTTADAGGAPATTAAPAEKPKKVKKICRSDNATGSHVRGTKICMTREEWRSRGE